MNDEYQIESGVALPERASSGGRPARYPWAHMASGDSFLVRCERESRAKKQRALGATGKVWCQRHRKGWTVSTRQVEEGVRVWMLGPESEQ